VLENTTVAQLAAQLDDRLKFADKKVTLPGGSKDELRMLPEFKYAKS
jgi:hypothetical protein